MRRLRTYGMLLSTDPAKCAYSKYVRLVGLALLRPSGRPSTKTNEGCVSHRSVTQEVRSRSNHRGRISFDRDAQARFPNRVRPNVPAVRFSLLSLVLFMGCGSGKTATPAATPAAAPTDPSHEAEIPESDPAGVLPTEPTPRETSQPCSVERVAQSPLTLRPAPPAAHETSGSGDFPAPPEPPGVSGTLEVSSEERVVRLHYPLESDPHGDCKAHAWVERPLPACTEPLSYALESLLEGPTASEAKAHSLVDSTRGRGAPLLDSFLGVRLTSSGVAVLEFSAPAMAYLNQAACAQVSVKSALLRTATQFEGVLDIAFVVEGKLVTEWDA